MLTRLNDKSQVGLQHGEAMELITSILLALAAVVIGIGLIVWGVSGLRRRGSR